MKRNKTCILLCIIMAISSGFSEVIFSGDQDGYIEEGEYLATGPITVKAGKTLTFAPGCIIRFKQYAGLTVYGTLKCAGTPGKPVVFTSNNHRPSSGSQAKAPTSFDWNGIIVFDSAASIDLKYVRVVYGTFGIDVKSSASHIALKQVVFTENGRGGLTVNGNQVEVKDNEPFSFVQPVPVVVNSVNTLEHTGASAAKASTHNMFPWKMSIRIASGTVALAGIAAGSYYYYRASKNQDSFESSTTTNEADSYQHKRNDARKYSTIGSIVAGLGCAGFAVTFCF
jgi:hypothetical protein